MTPDEVYQRALELTLAYEGGYVNHPDDPGGATNRGVTQRTYSAWLIGKGQPDKDVREITEEDVQAIYRLYWDGVRGDELAPALAIVAFDVAVNHGTARALEKGRSLTYPLPSGVPAPVISTDLAQQAYSLGAIQRLQQADDLSGNGHHLVAIAAANRPHLLEGVLTRGFGMMGFQSGYALATAASPLAANSPYAFAAVLSNWTVNAGFKALMSAYAGGIFALGVPASSDKLGFNHASRFLESSVGLTVAPQIVLACYAAGPGTFIRINGVETASSSSVMNYSAPPRLGFNYINATMNGQYRQSRPLVWNVALTTAQAERVEGFLAHRFFLTDVLPSGHPFKSSPPV